MSFAGKKHLHEVSGRIVLVGLAVVLLSSLVLAQSSSTPKWDAFATYQWLRPGGKVAAHTDPSNPTPYKIPNMSQGFGASVTYNAHPNVGVEFDFGRNLGKQNNENTISAGPRFMLRTNAANFFVHALASYNRLSVSSLRPSDGVGAILGGGMDVPVSKDFSIRLFQADYVWTHHDFFGQTPLLPQLARPSLQGLRLRTGVGYRWGGKPDVAPAVSCSAQPATVTVGEQVTVTATASNFDPKHKLAYRWSGTGVAGSDRTATIDTARLAPGTYAVTATVSDTRKKNRTASCSAQYIVKPLPPKNPPVMTCAARPATVQPEQPTSISCTCSSPDNVPVSVAGWTATAGMISGAGETVTLDPHGAAPGAVTVAATCTDSRGLTQKASTQVIVEKPAPVSTAVTKQLEARLALHSVYFPTAQPTVKKPQSGLVWSQKKTLLALADDFKQYVALRPNAQLILEGHADQRGSVASNAALSERRVALVKDFLVAHGVPQARIDTKAFGAQHNLSAAEVKASVDQNSELTSEQRARLLKNVKTIIWASNRRVDITLNTGDETQTSVRRYPFNAADSLTLIGGSDAPSKAKATKKAAAKKGTKARRTR